MQSEKNSVNVKKSLFIFNIAIPFGGNYLKKIIRKICEDTDAKMFMIALFIIVK